LESLRDIFGGKKVGCGEKECVERKNVVDKARLLFWGGKAR